MSRYNEDVADDLVGIEERIAHKALDLALENYTEGQIDEFVDVATVAILLDLEAERSRAAGRPPLRERLEAFWAENPHLDPRGRQEGR